MITEVKLNKKEENPFYGLRNSLNLLQQGGKNSITTSLLDLAYSEVRKNKTHRELFYTLLFSIGDITARKHNIFKGNKVDSGGNSCRDAFFIIMEWMKKNDYEQFKNFLFAHLFNEYTCFDNLFRSRVQTKNKKVIKVYDVFSDERYRNNLVAYTVSIIKGNNPFDKAMVAKFLTLPRVTKRAKAKKMLPETSRIMDSKVQFLIELSKAMNWSYSYTPRGLKNEDGSPVKPYANFSGYRAWRKNYNGDLESVLFSTGKILEFDKQGFLNWLSKIPSNARFRVRNRVMFEKDGVFKYPNLRKWYNEWESYKEEKQKEQRVLEEKVRQGNASQEDKIKLTEVKKEAKVNVGAVNFVGMFSEIVAGKVDKIKIQPFLDKINLPYNTLTFVDDSGSMTWSGYNVVRPIDLATFIATICLTKNPDDDGRSLLGLFSRECRLYNHITAKTQRQNSLLLGQTKSTLEPLIKPEDHFLDNLKRVRGFMEAMRTGNNTNISAIPDYLSQQLKREPEMLEQLQKFPIWTIISDGNWNNMHSPEASINDMLRRCENFLGFKPYIIAIDVAQNSSAIADRFSGIENFMYIPPNPAQIEQFLTNFRDMDVFDAYTPLLSLYRSNRYDWVKANVL